MPLNRAAAKTRLANLLDDMARRTTAGPQDRVDYASELVDLMADLMTTATITGNVSTTGTAAAQAGTITTARLS
ncbi:hypothetical protein IC235_17545 [Hymenobacter sp. BT664]|uniref:Uncharacterized protein n=1 Tax=Hymenobacter montanus TaxID=2771359 RepID=A0A927BGQ7_9BACT|nr:hypothetical protein [Hymenobacter montanus]MBD2769697.1 hypothetical protein [Hymenobacter montanus]